MEGPTAALPGKGPQGICWAWGQGSHTPSRSLKVSAWLVRVCLPLGAVPRSRRENGTLTPHLYLVSGGSRALQMTPLVVCNSCPGSLAASTLSRIGGLWVLGLCSLGSLGTALSLSLPPSLHPSSGHDSMAVVYYACGSGTQLCWVQCAPFPPFPPGPHHSPARGYPFYAPWHLSHPLSL